MRYIYGPVPSRRLGLSLGIDIIPKLTCTFECIYCQLGKKQQHVSNWHGLVFPDTDKIIQEVKDVLKTNTTIDYLTLAGSGEPTLNPNIETIIDQLRQFNLPIALITNSSLLHYEYVFTAATTCDLVVPSLDAGDEKTFESINNPAGSIKLHTIVDALKKMCKYAKGQVWLEIMLIEGTDTNCTTNSIKSIIKQVNHILPTKVQLNTCVRPPNNLGIFPLSQKKLEEMRKIFEREVNPTVKVEVVPYDAAKYSIPRIDAYVQSMKNMLQIRPSTVDDLSNSFGISLHEVIKNLEILKKSEIVVKKEKEGKIFYFIE